MEVAIAALTFFSVVLLVAGTWWFFDARRRIGERLKVPAQENHEVVDVVRRVERSKLETLLGRTTLERLETLLRQAGRSESAAWWIWIIGACGLVGGVAGWLRLERLGPGLLVAVVTGSFPILYLVYLRHQRMRMFQAQFPDALDTMSRALRTGYAFGGAVQLVGEEMPEPVGAEFRRVTEEIRLGVDPTDALVRLRQRVPTEDLNFFCTVLMIQRSAGGNLTEVLDHLSEVIRERFKLLSHIRALAAQHKWSAICVGASPVIFALIFQLLNPKYFDPLWASPFAPFLLGGGAVFEVIGFVMVWRISKIEV